jgi:hypothetical protein
MDTVSASRHAAYRQYMPWTFVAACQNVFTFMVPQSRAGHHPGKANPCTLSPSGPHVTGCVRGMAHNGPSRISAFHARRPSAPPPRLTVRVASATRLASLGSPHSGTAGSGRQDLAPDTRPHVPARRITARMGTGRRAVPRREDLVTGRARSRAVPYDGVVHGGGYGHGSGSEMPFSGDKMACGPAGDHHVGKPSPGPPRLPLAEPLLASAFRRSGAGRRH